MRRRLAYAVLAITLSGCKGTDRSVITVDQHDMSTSSSPDLAGLQGPDMADPVVGQMCGPGMFCPCGYVCGVGGRCEVSDIHPACTWSNETTGTVDLYGVWGSSSTNVYAVGGTPGSTGGTGNPGVIVQWNGTAWSSSTNLINLLSISGASTGSAFAVGEYGAEGSATYLQGTTWSTRDVLAPGTLRGAWQTSPGSYAVGDNGVLLYTTESGIPGSWGMQASNTNNTLHAVWGSSTSNVYVVGAGGLILHTTNAGVGTTPTWNKTIQGSSELMGVWGSSDADVYVVGSAPAVILHSTDGGNSWSSTTPSPSVIGLFAVGGRSATEIYAVGATGGLIFRSTGNNVWGTEMSPVTKDLFGVWVASNGEAFAVGRGGTIVHRH
jgi:hypothetical protein